MEKNSKILYDLDGFIDTFSTVIGDIEQERVAKKKSKLTIKNVFTCHLCC